MMMIVRTLVTLIIVTMPFTPHLSSPSPPSPHSPFIWPPYPLTKPGLLILFVGQDP